MRDARLVSLCVDGFRSGREFGAAVAKMLESVRWELCERTWDMEGERLTLGLGF
jgi:hypothetical protein